MRGLPSTRATSGRAANASATSSGSFHQDCVNDVERTDAQARVHAAIAGLAPESSAPCSTGFGNTNRPFSALVGKLAAAAQVGLVSQHNEKFRLLTVGSVFHNPRRDLA